MIKLTLLAAPFAVLALAPAPALARDRSGDSADLVRMMENPRTQDAVGSAMEALFGALMAMPAEPFARVMDSTGNHDAARAIPKGATLGDLAGPEARAMPRAIKRRVPAMMSATGAMLGVLDTMTPQLEAIGKTLERDLGQID